MALSASTSVKSLSEQTSYGEDLENAFKEFESLGFRINKDLQVPTVNEMPKCIEAEHVPKIQEALLTCFVIEDDFTDHNNRRAARDRMSPKAQNIYETHNLLRGNNINHITTPLQNLLSPVFLKLEDVQKFRVELHLLLSLIKEYSPKNNDSFIIDQTIGSINTLETDYKDTLINLLNNDLELAEELEDFNEPLSPEDKTRQEEIIVAWKNNYAKKRAIAITAIVKLSLSVINAVKTNEPSFEEDLGVSELIQRTLENTRSN